MKAKATIQEQNDIYSFTKCKWFRYLFAVAMPLLFVWGVLYLYRFGSPYGCVIFRTFGVYCPGCGSGRAAYDLVHFRILEALHHNELFVLAVPFIFYYLIKQYLFIVFSKNVLPFFVISPRGCYIGILILAVFTLLRNLPFFPFTLLAP